LRFDGNKFKGLKETWISNENGARADITKQFLTSLGNNSIIITKNNSGSEEKQLARDYFVHSFQTKSPKISSFENELFNWNVDWDTWLGEFINGTNDGDGIYGISFDPTIK
jgi:imidazoleglycerol phosphate synthase glutamine amidotransferase subunit HisH